MNKLRHILQSRYIFKILAFIFILCAIIYVNYYPFKSKYNINDKVFIGSITKITIKDKVLILEIKGREKLIVRYEYEEENLDNLYYGDKVLVNGFLTQPKKNTIPNTFNYRKYLYNKKIYYIVKANQIKKIENNNNYLYTIKNIIYKRIRNFKSYNYLKVFLLSDKTEIDTEVKENYQNIGISHLFSISGMHISFITGIIYLYLDKVTYNKKIKYLVIDIFLISYFLLLGSFSLFRSVIMYLLFSINNFLKLEIKKIDIMFLTLIIAISINPFIIYDIGFIYSFIISFFLVLFSSKIKRSKGIKKTILVTIISFLVSFPITVYNNYEINIISILANILLVPFVSIILFPLSIITFLLPFLDNLYYFLTTLLENFTMLIGKIDITKIMLCKPNYILISFYYIVIIFILKRPKLFYIFIILIIFHKMAPYFNDNYKITFFDVGEGDSILISMSNNKGNILIDTGMVNDSYSKMKNEIIPYFKSIGINKIDYLIITHGDSDHIGDGINLVNNFKVDKVIFNIGEYNDLELGLIKILKKENIKYFQGLNELTIGNDKLYFLNRSLYDNENDNSSVIYTELNGIKLLLMGDAGVDVEEQLPEKYNIENVDILKVGHHGSNTSSSKKFIDNIKPKTCLISVGRNNRYGHPKKDVLDTLGDYCNIYRTDTKGSIEIKTNQNGYMIKNYSP